MKWSDQHNCWIMDSPPCHNCGSPKAQVDTDAPATSWVDPLDLRFHVRCVRCSRGRQVGADGMQLAEDHPSLFGDVMGAYRPKKRGERLKRSIESRLETMQQKAADRETVSELLDEYQHVRQVSPLVVGDRAEELLDELSEYLPTTTVRRLRSARTHIRAFNGRGELDDLCASIRAKLMELV